MDNVIFIKIREKNILYDKNAYTFTRLGKIENISQSQLKSLLGDGDVTVTLSIK